jgi:hypothetical protein
MTEEERGPAAARPPTPEADGPDSLAAIVPKSRLWPVFAVLGVVVLVAGLLGYRELTATDPLRILVAIDLDGYWWEGSEPAAKLADALAADLGGLGFDPVKGGDPKVMKILEREKNPQAAAKKLGAGFVIQARLAPEVVEHPIKDGYFEVRVDAPVTLTFLDKGTASESRIRGYAYATKKDKAMALLADSMASQALDAVIAQLLDHPAVVEITSGSDVKLLERLSPARSFGKDRAKNLAETSEAYARPAREREAEGKGRVTFHSHAAAEDLLLGAGPGGYYVKTADVTAFYSFRHRTMGRSEELETVSFRTLDGKPAPTTDPAAPPPLWKGYHAYSYPSSQRDGDRVVLIEDLFGWAKTITMAEKSGASKRVRVDPEHRFVDPKLAPGGRFVAAYDRPRQGAPADLLVLDTQSGKELYAFHPEGQVLGGFTWIDATRLVFVSPAAEGGHLVVVDVSKQPIAIERPFKYKRGQELFMPSASRDGKWLAFAMTSAAPGVAVIDTTAWSQKVFPIAAGASWPSFSPDAGHVVFEIRGGGGTDVAVLALGSGAVKKIVESASEERLPLFSADGKRVLFEVRYREPVFPRVRGISRVASVAFEP